MKFSALSLAALLLVLVGLGASAAPTWQPANLAYYKAAQAQISDLDAFIASGLAAFKAGDAAAMKAAIADVQAVADYFGEEDAPAQLAPVGAAGLFAGSTCASTLQYFSQLEPDAATSPFAVPTLLVMRSDCAGAVQAARMELARSVAAVGAWPPTR